MNKSLKPLLRCLYVVLLLGAMGLPLETIALIGRPRTPLSVGGVARRTTRRVVVASSASANNAAAAESAAAADSAATAADAAESAATAANAAAAAASGVPAIGTIVTTLPAGCTTTTLNGVEYYNCGGVYYRAAFQGNNLVYVVQQP